MRVDILGRFSAIFYKGENFVISSLLSCTQSPFWKGTYYKKNEFAPTGSKFFLFIVGPFSEWRWNNFDIGASLESVLLRLNHKYPEPASVAQLDARPTGDKEVAGSTPAEAGNILSWRLIMKYFLRSFFLPSAHSRRAVVSFWWKNVHNIG